MFETMPPPKTIPVVCPVSIRWMIRQDMQAVVAIEEGSFEFPWDEDHFLQCLRQRNCIGMVAERENRNSHREIVGYMVYELHRNRLEVFNLAVAPDVRRRGVGRQLIAKLVGKLHPQRRSKMNLVIRETNLTAQLFLRECGFRASHLLRDYYKHTPEDAIHFWYRVTGA